MKSSSREQRQSTHISFKDLFRVVFVVFCLYLIGDAFFRWDGFRFHSTFMEFIPNVSLALILWSLVALCMTLGVWLVINAIAWLSRRIRSGIGAEHFFMATVFIILLGVLVWMAKKFMFTKVVTTVQLKLFVFLCTLGVSVFLTMQLRNKAGRWMDNLQERITPLVWLFSFLLLLSIPITVYQLVSQGNYDRDLQEAASIPPPNDKRPNIVLVTFDALTARDMSLYGYERPTTPFISEWSRNATVFTNLQAESNWTAPTTVSLMTGKRLWTHELYHSNVNKMRVIESVPSELKKYGYYNLAFVQNQFAHPKRMGMDTSFDIVPKYAYFIKPTTLIGWSYGALNVMFYRFFGEHFELYDWMISPDFILGQIFYRISGNLDKTPFPPGMAFDRFSQLINRKTEKPFFAWIHILPPHDPYLPPEPFMGKFDPSPELRVYPGNMLASINKLVDFKHENTEMLRARYDEFILYCDNQFEKFIKKLEESKMENTIIILSADHGESFEHDYILHKGPHLYEQVTHVPLIVKEPGQTEGKTIDILAEQIDISATIIDLSGIPVPSWMEGRSLMPLISGDDLPPRPAFAMNFDKNRGLGHQIEKGTIAVWEGDYKLIHYLEDGKNLLFNLREDPDELNNLYEIQPEKGGHLLGLIKENLERANERIRSENSGNDKTSS